MPISPSFNRRNPMPLGGLQHYTIEPSDLERTKDFYCEVLGLENGDRPPLDFPGYWLYSGGAATVHLMGTRKPREGIVVRGTEKKYEDTGALVELNSAKAESVAILLLPISRPASRWPTAVDWRAPGHKKLAAAEAEL